MMRKKSFRTELPVNASYPSGSRLSVSEERVQGECAILFPDEVYSFQFFFQYVPVQGGYAAEAGHRAGRLFLQRDFFWLLTS